MDLTLGQFNFIDSKGFETFYLSHTHAGYAVKCLCDILGIICSKNSKIKYNKKKRNKIQVLTEMKNIINICTIKTG
jgi:hypothetical protein